MKRMIVGVIAASLLLSMLAPALQAARYDPMNPPIEIPRDAYTVSDRPSGDDAPWADVDLAPPPPPKTLFELFGIRLLLGYPALIILPTRLDGIVPIDVQPEITPQQGEIRDAVSYGN